MEQQAKESMILQLKTNYDTFKCDIRLTVRVCTTKDSFLNMSLSKLVYCFFKTRY